jgi:hypothetical protein
VGAFNGDNGSTETKPVLGFQDNEQGLVLNKTNLNILADLFGNDLHREEPDCRYHRSPLQRLYAKPDVPAGNFDAEAHELDQFAKHAGLTDLEQIALVFMRGNTRKTDTEIAEVLGISQGYYSKLQVKIIGKLREGRKRLYGAPENPEIWSRIDDHGIFDNGDKDD